MQTDAHLLTLVRPLPVDQAMHPPLAPVIADTRSYFDRYRRVVAELPHSEIERVVDLLHQTYQERRRVFLFGNGGSAALASHFACDLSKGTVNAAAEKRFRVLALTDNIPLITAWANDTAYDQIFAEQLQNFIEPGDVAFGISGSGCSPNVLMALQVARQAQAITVGLTGFKGGKLPQLCEFCVVIPSDNMQIIEDLQLGITHAIFTVIRHRISQEFSSQASCTALAA
jgi:D-sedoheptulose 7-phosphate isomerase